MTNARPASGHPLAPRAAAQAPNQAPKRPGEPVWADAWREPQTVEQTLAKLTEALSRDQRTTISSRAHAVTRKGRPDRVRAFPIFAASCATLLAALGGLAVAFGWPSDSLGIGRSISALLSSVPQANTSETATAEAESEPPVLATSEPAAEPPGEASTEASTSDTAAAESVAVERGKTVATTKLMVADASGEALHYIPLSIKTDTTAGADKLAIRLTGLPAETVLTSGEDLGNGSWLLKPGEERDLKLAVQTNAPREILIGVEAIEVKTGELAAPPQDLRVKVTVPKLVVQPAADTLKPAVVASSAEAPAAEPPQAAKILPALELPALPETKQATPEPETQVAAAEPAVTVPSSIKVVAVEPAPEPDAKTAAVDPLIVSTVEPAAAVEPPAAPATKSTSGSDAGLISRGDSLMEMGEVIGARSFYQRAYGRGEPAAARSIARTYDPKVYADMNVLGLKPSAEKALEWYRKAQAAGVAEAATDIANLEAFMAKK